ncbi:trypsin-like peptidase domain-containing protein [Clostridium botulinum]|uniref:trypsin-like peptidase domain-containing protein n=1 Tax=Clostridium botulinum TaxID=1491 RepID=UPI0004D822C1|nr:trypsin-like peptidase domain-containing protein [Clostridium botulinum]KEI02954.1 hypothetical protein Z952_08925 [Clostridium botulinum C/D str. BKT75002]KEI12007.1 hypothetical protein Z954_06595 [Clostridium botulinum C/D str. BKT2873]KGM97783.1 hypothetical protein Z956_00940 [Clostridium botulinum D str. CCUG 7971]KOC45919.1 hypothetical protein ADU88_12955 [Clostridium botulinum]MCD3351980.1 trypsin-like peptidase domain-containing protein [Clostridium botulinum D/C]
MINCCNINKIIDCICNCEYRHFFSKANVIGIGLGYKTRKECCLFQKCITVFVSEKLPLNEIPEQDLIPATYRGIPTDVVESGITSTCSLRNKVRPVTGGYSIGVEGLQGGTLGCLVSQDGIEYALTCNHVISANNSHLLGKPVVQPATQYGGKVPNDTIGTVYRFIKVNTSRDDNLVDAAIIKTNKALTSSAITFVGNIKGVSHPKIGEKVKMVGSNSELKEGTVKTIHTTIKTFFLGEEVVFKNQIVTNHMSSPGDSGAILLSKNNEALGLLMSDGSRVTIYNDINDVLTQLRVNIVTGKTLYYSLA